MTRRIDDLPNAIASRDEIARRLSGSRLAVFLDYDGTLTPIAQRPQDAVISTGMRAAVLRLAGRCRVCLVTGRDRHEVEQLMGTDDLIVAASHGFDISGPAAEGVWLDRSAVAGRAELLAEVAARLRHEVALIQGAVVEPKKAAVTVHYRHVPEADWPEVGRLVAAVLAEHPRELKVTPGKMIYEIQPNVDWDKGRAVLYLLRELHLDGDDVRPVYLGDDVTDEYAFEALDERGVRVLVGRPDDAEIAGRTTAADYVLNTIAEVERFLGLLADWAGSAPR
jgi:trehalose 6-phosphate phosphatase